jgi:hypothetical protein
MSTFNPHGFVHEHLDGLGHGFEAVLDHATGKLRGWCSIGTGGSKVWSPFSVVTKKKPILAHFSEQTDRPSSVLVRSLRSRTRTELESDEFTEEKLYYPPIQYFMIGWDSVVCFLA